MRFHAKRVGAVAAALALGVATFAFTGAAEASPTLYNHAGSTATAYHHRAFGVAFHVDQLFSSSVSADNRADALGTHCTGCRSVAIAFQIVADGRVPTTVNADNYATSVNDQCTNCQTLGVAYQFVEAGPTVLSVGDRLKLAQIQWRLWALSSSNASASDVASQVDALAGQVESILANAGHGLWPWIHRYTTWS